MQVGTHMQAGSELHIWRGFLARTTLGLAVLLLASAAVCWVAANWPLMTKIQRLSSAQGLLIVCALLAAALYMRRPASSAAGHARASVLGLAGALLGAVLALVGQTYQTGADTWELFAWWTLLLLPWALAARSQGIWLFWALVLNVAVALLLGERVLSWWIVFAGPGFPSLVLAAVNLLMLAVWEGVAHRNQARTGVGPRVLALLAIGVLVLALMFGDFVMEGLGTYTGAAWIAVTLCLGYYYTRIRLDLVILALLVAGGICVSLRVVGEWLLRMDPGVWMALPLAALLMGEAVVAARWLRGLAGRGALGPADAEPAAASAGNAVDPAEPDGPVAQLAPAADAARVQAPWFVQALLGLSAWLATLLLLAFLLLSGLVTSPGVALVLGLVMCAVSIAMVRAAAGPFWRQCATAMGFAGQILVAAGLSDSNSLPGAAAFVLALAVVVYALAPDTILRFLSGWMMALALFVLISVGGGSPDSAYSEVRDWLRFDALVGIGIWLPAAVGSAWVAAAAFLAANRLAYRRSDMLQPLAWAFALASLAGAAMASGVPVWALPALWHVHPPGALSVVAGAVLPAVAAGAAIWPRRAMLNRGLRWGVPLGLLVLAVFWMPSPGVALALAWLVLGFSLGKPRLRRLGQVAILAYLVLYYYQLDLPLLQKALWLAGGAVLLLLMRGLVWLVPRLTRARAAAPRPVMPRAGPARTALIAAGLALTLAVVNGGIWQREKLLAGGHVVRLELAPADPRSIMQGDYMSLRFAVSNQVGRLQDDLPASNSPLPTPETDGYLVLVSDKQGVAQPLRVQPRAQPHTAQEIVLRYRLRADGVRIVTNAYFFPEGQAGHYQGARYGEFRVDDEGTGLLVRLLGPDLQPL